MSKQQIISYTLRGTEDDMVLVLENVLREVGKSLSYVGDDLLILLKDNKSPIEVLSFIRNLRDDLVRQDLHLEDVEEIYKEMLNRQIDKSPPQTQEEEEIDNFSLTEDENDIKASGTE